MASDAISTPNDHFTASPDCRVTVSVTRRVGSAGGHPTIRAGIVSAARVGNAARRRTITATPDDHFTAGPDCGVMESGAWRVGGAGGCPTIISARRITRLGNFRESVDNLP
jgi:hypothetical protein